ncbi:hypothetical protein HQN89_29830 [Paenibacillus frigoriresistens]|uniref:hypothetical protein n=1 Tax=Paenibacillus alginolyticus TaxID=59839 RepID=UPI00156640D7|nr:hypothetical protein [Paenibacillus frigoriresistens]NRF95092.1 hypothetical protein [Paenibacillus frigoriresistens]
MHENPLGSLFGNQNVKVVPFLANIVNLSNAKVSDEEKQIIIEKLRKSLEIAPPRGINQVIVRHSFPAGVWSGIIYLFALESKNLHLRSYED